MAIPGIMYVCHTVCSFSKTLPICNIDKNIFKRILFYTYKTSSLRMIKNYPRFRVCFIVVLVLQLLHASQCQRSSCGLTAWLGWCETTSVLGYEALCLGGGGVVPYIRRDHTAFICRIEHSKKKEQLGPEGEALWSPESLGTAHITSKKNCAWLREQWVNWSGSVLCRKRITPVNTHNVSVTQIVDSSSIHRAETKYGLRIQF